MWPFISGQDPIPCNKTISVASTQEGRQNLQKGENRALKWQSEEKVSEKGVKTVKIGFLSTSMHTGSRLHTQGRHTRMQVGSYICVN